METKLKILEGMDVYLPDVDGVINCMHNYSLNLSAEHEVTVAVPQNRKDYVDHFPYRTVRCKSLHLPVLNQYYGFPSRDKAFKEKLEREDFDVVHCHSPFNMSKCLLKIAKKKNIPAVATFHTNIEAIVKDVTKSRLIARIFMRCLGKRYNRFDEIFVCSPLVEKQVRACGYKGKVTYLPFGTDLPLQTNVSELREKANETLGLSADKTVFLYVGRVMKLKRIDFILKSLKKVKESGKDFVFYVVGKGAEMKKLKKLTAKLNLENEVKFLGFVDRELLPLLFARADLFLFPSLYDNFALVKVEAAAYATPGIFIENSCAGYGVTDGADGFLSADNPSAFADKINEAISDRERLSEIGENAAKNLYITWRECVDALEERLAQIVEERRKQNADKK